MAPQRKLPAASGVDEPKMMLTLSAHTWDTRGAQRTFSTTFEAAYAAHRHDVYRAALRFSGGRTGWAEDLTHDVFLKLFEHLPRLDAREDLGGWLYRVTANLAVSQLRRDRSLGFRLARFFVADEADPRTPVDLALTLRQDAARLLKALQRLPPQQAVVMTMKLLEGKSQKDISAALSLSEGYVSKLVTRSLDRLAALGWDTGARAQKEDSDGAP